MPLATLRMTRLDMTQAGRCQNGGARLPAPPETIVIGDVRAKTASGRPLHLAAGFRLWRRYLGARHQALDTEHVVRVALRCMRLAGKNGAHQFMIAGSV